MAHRPRTPWALGVPAAFGAMLLVVPLLGVLVRAPWSGLGAQLTAHPSLKVRAEAIPRFREVRSSLDRTIETLYNLTADEAALVHRRFAAPA